MKKYLTEFIGTFFLVFTIGAIAIFTKTDLGPIAIGLVLAIMVYAGGNISGGHYNPAVSLAATIRGALPKDELLPYIIFQILGGACASLIIFYLEPNANTPYIEYDLLFLTVGEILFTFALCYTVLFTATSPKTQGNQYFGLAIGGIVTVGAIAVSSICLGAFNPAVAISLGIMGIAPWSIIGITILVNLVAGAIAAGVYKSLDKE